ncbi:DUF6804 family protein [Methylacidiphilum caldifontis]|uniref:DUF6804 family protein n=1 Tax=Methylacidiphilum caldifontis TaxID=2795386 RepID=UPI0036F2A78A
MPVAVIYIAVAILFIGAAPLPYGYHMLLRFVITGVFAWAALVSYNRKDQSLPWVFGLLASLFNPIVKIHCQKSFGHLSTFVLGCSCC